MTLFQPEAGEPIYDLSKIDPDELLALDLEYKLTIAHRIDCWCSEYLVQRRLVLIPAILEQAHMGKLSATDLMHSFQQRLHAEKCPAHTDPTKGRVAMFLSRVAEALAEEDEPPGFWGESKADDDGR